MGGGVTPGNGIAVKESVSHRRVGFMSIGVSVEGVSGYFQSGVRGSGWSGRCFFEVKVQGQDVVEHVRRCFVSVWD